ncbi:hypothetical protein [Auritidibacter ignavus]|nr:hypothetical protein [Auritidibacter ignavus]PXA82213.1 hypothetical protein DCC26_01520 [Auritidibacter sp. NML120779]WHS29080.1 hypothetical protein QM395_04990 [Auritidibacter ignavus]
MRALDAIVRLPGFVPDHVERNGFRFWGSGAYMSMHTVTIYTYPAERGEDTFVRLAGTETRPITSQGRRLLSPEGVAEQLGAALEETLRLYNEAHYPYPIRVTVDAPPAAS